MRPLKIFGTELVSIIIPCYNQGHFLADAVQSALAQTYPHTEIVVVDDGSTDRTAEVARSFPHVAYIFQRNRGRSAARNTGFRASTGTFVLFLDADDRLLPNAIDAGLACFRAHPESGFVFGRYCRIDAQGEVISAANQPANERDFYLALLQRNLIGMQSTVLYPRNILNIVGAWDLRLHGSEDYELYLRIARRFPVNKHEELVAEYRAHDSNTSLNYRSMLQAALRTLASQKTFIARDPQYRAAAAAGASNWRAHYGSLMLQDFLKHSKVHGWDRGALRRLGNLAACYPRGIRALALGALRGMIHRSPPEELKT